MRRCLTALGILLWAGPVLAGSQDRVHGNLVLITENGGWCWYQDPRAIVDPAAGQLVIGSVGNHQGFDGAGRDGDVDVTTFTLRTGDRRTVTLRNLPSYGGGDDHNAAALWLRPDGRTLAMYTGHNERSRNTWYRISEPRDPTRWGTEQAFDWGAAQPGTDANVTYGNLHFLADEGRLYNIVRERDRSPHVAVSENGGTSWRYAGMLTAPAQSVGYSNGYFRFADDGEGRLHFVATEHHPRDFNTSIFHGYLEGGRTFDSHGRVLDEDLFDDRAPSVEEFTCVLRVESEDQADVGHHRAWTTDLALDAEGRPVCLFTSRYGNGVWPEDAPADDPRYRGTDDHRLFQARFDGGSWQVTELCRMGRQLYRQEQDYTGLGALDPSDPDTLYVSTAVDPRDDTVHERRELFRGRTGDGGATWTWAPLTEGSTADNCRPVVLSWAPDSTAVLWWRGTYESQHRYDTALVGWVDTGERTGPITYVDATADNTRRADGTTPTAVGSGDGRGPAEGLWSWRRGYGNGGQVLAAGGSGPEDAPALETRLQLPTAGTYDLFAFFWANPEEDWRLAAGLEGQPPLVFRRMACQQADPAEFTGEVITAAPTVALYQAYLGRRSVVAPTALTVQVDDARELVPDGTARTWYDGLGYATVQGRFERREGR